MRFHRHGHSRYRPIQYVAFTRKTFVGTVLKIPLTSRPALKSPIGSKSLRRCCHTTNSADPGRYSHLTTALPRRFLTLNDGSRIFYEPLAGFDPDGNLVPALAEETPSLKNRGVSHDGRSVTWKLRTGVNVHSTLLSIAKVVW